MVSRRDLARLPVNVDVSSKTEPSKVSGELRLMAVGDLMMGSNIRHGEAGLPPNDGKELFTGLADITLGPISRLPILKGRSQTHSQTKSARTERELLLVSNTYTVCDPY